MVHAGSGVEGEAAEASERATAVLRAVLAETPDTTERSSSSWPARAAPWPRRCRRRGAVRRGGRRAAPPRARHVSSVRDRLRARHPRRRRGVFRRAPPPRPGRTAPADPHERREVRARIPPRPPRGRGRGADRPRGVRRGGGAAGGAGALGRGGNPGLGRAPSRSSRRSARSCRRSRIAVDRETSPPSGICRQDARELGGVDAAPGDDRHDLPAPRQPRERGGDGIAPAPSATTCALVAKSRTASAARSGSTTSEPSRSVRASSNISGKTTGAPIPSTKLGWYGTSTGSAGLQRRSQRRRRRDLGGEHATPPGSAHGSPRRSRSSALRRRTGRRGIHFGRSSTTSSPIVPLPAITCRSLNGWTNAPRRPGIPRAENAEPLVDRHRDDARAQTLDRRELRLGGRVGHHDGGRDAPGRCAYHATPWAMFPALAVHTPLATSSSASDSMRARAADLERSDRLQDLELQVDLGVGKIGVQTDDRRTDRRARDPIARRSISSSVRGAWEISLGVTGRRSFRGPRRRHDRTPDARRPRLDRVAGRLVQGQLVVRAATGWSPESTSPISASVDGSIPCSSAEPVGGGFSAAPLPLDEHGRVANGRRVDLGAYPDRAHARRRQPVTAGDDWLVRVGAAAYDVRASDGFFEDGRRPRPRIEPWRAPPRGADHADEIRMSTRSNAREERVQVRGRPLDASAHDRERASAGTGQRA